MFNHVKKHKHQKNFLKLKYNDRRIDSLTKNEILIQALEYAEKKNILFGDDRDYQAIKVIVDYDEYLKLKNRPATWSENKEKLGLVGNTNYEPIIPRKRRNHDAEESSAKRVCVDQFAEGWSNWRANTDQEILLDRQRDIELLFNMCREMVDNHLANPAEDSFNLCKQEISQLRGSIELDLQIFEDKKDFFSTKLAKLNNIEENLQLKSDEEERAGKDINKGLLDLEQEMHLYASDRESKAYKNYKERLATLTGQIQKFKPEQPAMLKRREEFNNRLAEIWKNFEERSESVVEIQNKIKNTGGATLGGNINGSVSASNTAGSSNVSASKLRQEERSRFTAEFKVEVMSLVEVEVVNLVSNRVDNNKQEIINKIVFPGSGSAKIYGSTSYGTRIRFCRVRRQPSQRRI
ncbi:uncharacterized protein LOC111708272 isoform X2 [Eurytemora carolleeae]|uniref:uncharacterized protein LOC111708272 isoform X2 n=1 Tax=Eurytemora carolleeae TaxID=1294199 RepID=UPI000C772AE9|nr:uncharacterized protein LOC111708272 isoform X2 [Eurytemora carolleeae]|eukprot:XP_023337464.1 uncharacterized protein LOC111708272 isoform X2 [Eurytemora affinis]